MNQVLLQDLTSEDQKSNPTTANRSQWNIYTQFTNLILRLRFKKPSFWIVQGICIAIALLSLAVKPKNKPMDTSKTDDLTIEWEYEAFLPNPDITLVQYNTPMGFYPSNKYTIDIANKVNSSTYKKTNSITVFAKESDYKEFLETNFKTFINFQNPSPNVFNITGGAMHNLTYLFSDAVASEFLGYVLYNETNYQSQIKYSRITDSTKFTTATEFYQVAAFIVIADFLMFFHSFTEFLEFREKKQFLLLEISGAKESILYLACFTVDLSLSFLHSLIQTEIINIYSKKPNFLFLFVMMFFLNLYQYFFYFIIVILTYIQKYFKSIIIIVVLISSLFPSLFGILNGMGKDLTVLIQIYRFFPQGSLTLFFDNLMYCYIYGHHLSFSNAAINYHFVPTSQIALIALGMFCAVLFILWFLDLMYPRSSGTPPIGFKNIFLWRYWKKVFLNSKTDASYREECHFIDVQNINKIYSGKVNVHALQDVSFFIDKGEIIILIGPNGSGKSTLLNSMTGSIDCNSGSLKLYGNECAAGFSEMQQCLGICFQENVYFDRLNVREHLNFFGLIRGMSKNALEAEVDRCIDHFGLSACEGNRAESLSGGQKRKLCIALAFIGSPQFVILDEPTAGIDVTTRQTIWKAISGYGITSLVSSHSLEEAESISSRLFVMRNGQMIFDGPSNELRRKYHCGYRLQPMYISDINKAQANQNLLEFCKQSIPDSVLDDQHEDSILMPACKDVVQLLDNLEKRKKQFQMNDFNIIVEQLENVLYRMYVDDENAALV
ncbi:ABC transporter family protein [Trichomonas vaginalis G3]|uniref:ABC transporter family protein n=1 Tax=Trichomonas vaginalis (strain ATCC PRA-98 / G3) TaxID=412133 RepID=A2F5R9_TRIV3|nr:ATPase activity, coupled to transmembrane movement of substances [Trichomonas vaginalis G3]EAX99769.1 ABC transporter family protein [Trichomonas vaginalis G3]KAI5489054.1 ATPase activity, coupled to transmembrane movement of substances [Trichomonas vaginalis G3]|eukprot:XP_001312699.1 ABC transporter family protein [Trichomonas vaginalis G3]